MTAPNLQSTAVTALDIRGADALWRDAPEAMGASVALFEELLERSLREYGGVRLSAGRADIAAGFDDVDAALDWATAVQQELVELDWPAALLEQPQAALKTGASGDTLFRGLRVSGGVDVGPLDSHIAAMSGEVFVDGEALQRALELARRASAGCVALSPVAVDLLDADRAGGPMHEVDGVATVVCERLPGPEAADLERPARRSNLPEFAGAFIDRVRERDALVGVFDDGERHVALCGGAGVGKSRLAVEFARRWMRRGDEPAEAWFCDLAEIDAVDEALFAIARTAGVQIPRSETVAQLEQSLGMAFRGRGAVMLVLDDVDLLGDRLTDIIAGWIEQADNLHVLVTRQRRPQDETAVIDVDALGRASARALLEDRLEHPVGASVDLDDSARLLMVVDRCGRLPLALELVASTARHSFGQSFEAPPSATSAPSKLVEALDRSWGLLEPVERAALSACTVFAGSFTAPAAMSVIEAAVGADASGAELLAALREYSLIRSDGQRGEVGRLVVLAPVRDFVANRADEAVVAAARRQHLAYFSEWAGRLREVLRGEENPAWFERARADLPNLYRAADFGLDVDTAAALAILEALGDLDTRVGPLGGFVERTDAVVRAARDVDAAVLLRALKLRATTLMWSGQYADAEQTSAEARRLAEQLDDASAETYALSAEGFAMAMQGREEHGLPRVREAARRARDDESFDSITVLANASVVARHRGHIEESADYLHQALLRARKRHNAFTQASSLFLLGATLRYDQQWQEAIRSLEEAIELFESIDDRRGQLVAYHELAQCYDATDQVEQAERCYGEAMELAAAVGEREYSGMFWLGRGRSRFARGEFSAAESDLLEAVIALDEVGHIHLKIPALMYLGATYGALDRLAEARAYFERVERLFEETDVTGERASYEVLYGYLEAARARELMRADDPAGAREVLESVYERIEKATAAGAPARSARKEAERLREYLDQRVERGELPAGASPERIAFRVPEDLSWFAVGDEERVDISRRGLVRRILRALIERRVEAPGEPLTADDVLAAGWPDEVLTAESASQRIYMTISRMRKLGLQDALETIEEGYRIAPAYTPVWEDEG